MKLVLGLLAGLWSLSTLYGSPAWAQEALVVTTCGTLPQPYAVGSTQKPTVNTSGAACTTGGAPPSSPFTGVLDVVPASPLNCWSFRACSAAIAAAGTQKLFQVQRTSDNNTCDFLVAHSGDVGLSTSCTMGANGVSLATFLNATVGRLTKFYGQLGGYDFTTGVITEAPLIVLNCTGGKPCARGDGTRRMAGFFTGNVLDPISLVAVAENTATSGFGNILAVLSQFGFQPPNKTGIALNAGLTAPAADNQFHSIQVLTSASGHINVDGVSTPGDTHSGGWSNGGYLFSYNDGNNALTGSLAELVAWGRANSTMDEYNLCTNQHAYWGTPVACVAPSNPQVLLLHADGTNGSTSFPDSSGKGNVATSHSGAVVGNTISKFSGAAALGAMGYLTVGGSADFSFGTADFTIDMWVYITQDLEHGIFTTADSGTISPTSLSILIYSSNYAIRVANNQFLNLSLITLNAWTHIALVRASGVTQFYVNGVSKFSQADTSSYSNIANGTYIGTFSDGFQLNGYVDEIRVLKGQAAWTSNFTPPTAPYSPP